MPLDDARDFVMKMRENREFRERCLQTNGPEELSSFLHGEGMRFDQRELVGAMAECMVQLEQRMGE